jgi:hypothetical protein
MSRGLSDSLSDGVELAAAKGMEESWPTQRRACRSAFEAFANGDTDTLRQLMVKTPPSGIRRAATSSRVTTAASALAAGNGQQYLQVLGGTASGKDLLGGFQPTQGDHS